MAKELSVKDIGLDLAPRKAPQHRVAANLYIVRETAGSDGRWLFIYRSPLLGRRVDMGLGPARDVSLRQAKIEALEHRLTVHKGRCPLSERRSAEAARPAPTTGRTFKQVAELYIAAHAAGWKNAKHGGQWAPPSRPTPIRSSVICRSARSTPPRSWTSDPIWRSKTETASRAWPCRGDPRLCAGASRRAPARTRPAGRAVRRAAAGAQQGCQGQAPRSRSLARTAGALSAHRRAGGRSRARAALCDPDGGVGEILGALKGGGRHGLRQDTHHSA